MSDRHQRRRRVLAVLLTRQAPERPRAVEEADAREALYPPPRSVDTNPLFPPPAGLAVSPLNEARPHLLGLPPGGRAHELVFDETDSTA